MTHDTVFEPVYGREGAFIGISGEVLVHIDAEAGSTAEVHHAAREVGGGHREFVEIAILWTSHRSKRGATSASVSIVGVTKLRPQQVMITLGGVIFGTVPPLR